MTTQVPGAMSDDDGGVLGHASAEWARRPADQSFLSLEELHAAVEKRTRIAKEIPGVQVAILRTEAQGENLRLVGERRSASFTNWSFGQLAKLVQAPAGFLRELPATLASQVMNVRLKFKGRKAGAVKLLLEENGETKIRAFTGDGYSRIWDRDITRRLIGMQDKGWRPAPETELHSWVTCKACDGDTGVAGCVCGGTGKERAKTRGLYASDHDVFAFLVDNERRIFERDPGGGLSRGVIVANSEVGDKSFWVLTFLYAYVCGNHNIWGVRGVQELRIRHQGQADARAFGELQVLLKAYAEASAQEDEARILRLKARELGKDQKEVLDKVFAMLGGDLSRKLLGEAWQRAEMHESWYGAPPTSAWGLGNGVTEVAREIQHADRRVEVERAAGRIFEQEGF